MEQYQGMFSQPRNLPSHRTKDMHTESETTEPASDRLSQQSQDDSFAGDRPYPSWQEPDADTKHLVDVDPEEGRRMGSELMSMLSDLNAGSKASSSTSAPLLPAPTWLRKPDVTWEDSHLSGKAPASASAQPHMSVWPRRADASWEELVAGGKAPAGAREQGFSWAKKAEAGWEVPGTVAEHSALQEVPRQSDYSYMAEQDYAVEQWNASQSQSHWECKHSMASEQMPHQYSTGAAAYFDYQSLHAELIPALYEAGHLAFGPGGTANVSFLPDGMGYEVWVQGAIASEVEQGREEFVLEALCRALWPTLSDTYLYMERHTEQVSGGLRMRLWRSCEDEATDSQRCWVFVRHGYCERGNSCRWLHEMPETIPVEIKVSAAARVAK
eukprot:TRINITY_DN49200_c0_g1_i1.p1 TRINITY_DN49200_c0_g1~~TRINITY_DN49200_c0_g1_i1.p1  ORF type:complete len:384 (+),score=77.81 TRINITY_DN49200_c0_g1_i1:138-1289(+)